MVGLDDEVSEVDEVVGDLADLVNLTDHVALAATSRLRQPGWLSPT